MYFICKLIYFLQNSLLSFLYQYIYTHIVLCIIMFHCRNYVQKKSRWQLSYQPNSLQNSVKYNLTIITQWPNCMISQCGSNTKILPCPIERQPMRYCFGSVCQQCYSKTVLANIAHGQWFWDHAPNGDHHNLAKVMNRLSSNAQAVAARISMPNITSSFFVLLYCSYHLV